LTPRFPVFVGVAESGSGLILCREIFGVWHMAGQPFRWQLANII